MGDKQSIKLGICQMAVIDDKEANIEKAEAMVIKAAQAGCKIAILPEMFNCPYQSEAFEHYAESYDSGATVKMLAKVAAREKIVLVGGSIPERGDDQRVYNTSFIFDSQGNLVGRHRKIHLFDVEIKGGTIFQESLTLAAGQDMTVVKVNGVVFGVAICYDARFPELSRAMTLAGAELLIFPAAFGPVTGPAHWELLLRSRAVDNQVFVIGAAPARTVGAQYQAYGHSMVVNPWGEVLATTDDRETILIVDTDLKVLEKVREELPLLKHRRTDIYCRIHQN